MSITNYFGKPKFEFKNKYRNSLTLNNIFSTNDYRHMYNSFEYFDTQTITYREIRDLEFEFYEKGIHRVNINHPSYDKIPRKINDNDIYCHRFQPHIHLKPVIDELYDNDEQIIETQKINNNQISSLQEKIKCLKKQNELNLQKIEKLEKNYEQLLINWTTITEYMKRIDDVEKHLILLPWPAGFGFSLLPP